MSIPDKAMGIQAQIPRHHIQTHTQTYVHSVNLVFTAGFSILACLCVCQPAFLLPSSSSSKSFCFSSLFFFFLPAPPLTSFHLPLICHVILPFLYTRMKNIDQSLLLCISFLWWYRKCFAIACVEMSVYQACFYPPLLVTSWQFSISLQLIPCCIISIHPNEGSLSIFLSTYSIPLLVS